MYVFVCEVYAEVETRIGALRSLLLGKLLETPSTLHDQKRYIRWVYSCRLTGGSAQWCCRLTDWRQPSVVLYWTCSRTVECTFEKNGKVWIVKFTKPCYIGITQISPVM